jgi:multidrug efflux pump subunit AcrA (membrane-fusion protein)
MSQDTDVSSQPLLDEEDFDEADFSAAPPKRSHKGLIITLIVIIVIVLLVAFLVIRRSAVRAQATYTRAQVQTGTLSQTVSATGPIAANNEYDVNVPASGQLMQVLVHVGDHVNAGQSLATYTVTTAQGTTNQLTLTAPASSTVAAINSGTGSGNANSTPLIILTDTSSLKIAAAVNEADIAKLKVGQAVTFTVAAYPSQTFKASVATIDTVGQTASSVVTYTVYLNVDMSSLDGAHVYPGMTATTSITTAQVQSALMVPAAALSFPATALQNGLIGRAALQELRQTGLASAQSTTSTRGVVLLVSNGKLVPTIVTTGLSNGEDTQILSGLQAGDIVVTGQANAASSTGSASSSTSATGAAAGGGGGLFGGLFRNRGK